MRPQALQSIALAVAEARSVDLLLQRIVDGLLAEPDIALARIWLIAPGDICSSSCPVRSECPDQTRCLHLLASAGRSIQAPGEDWARLTGGFRRVPLNVWKVGHIGGTGSPMLITDHLGTDAAIARPDWVKAEGIMTFAGQPLIFKGEVLGVLAVFSRASVGQAQFEWLRTVAAHAAVALANARAFEELTRLREQDRGLYRELQEREARIRQDELELRRIIDAIPEAIIGPGPDGSALDANAFMLEFTGLTLDEIKADVSRTRRFHPDDVERLQDERRKALVRGEPFEAEFRIRRKDGHYRWFLVRYNPFR